MFLSYFFQEHWHLNQKYLVYSSFICYLIHNIHHSRFVVSNALVKTKDRKSKTQQFQKSELIKTIQALFITSNFIISTRCRKKNWAKSLAFPYFHVKKLCSTRKFSLEKLICEYFGLPTTVIRKYLTIYVINYILQILWKGT